MELKHARIFASVTLILLCIVGYTLAFTVRDGEEGDREQVPIGKPSLWEIFKNSFSLYRTSPWKVSSYAEKGKSLVRQLHGYFFHPPNLESFRGTCSSDDEARFDQHSSHGGGAGDGGAGERVKEAVSKSFGKSKETVEDTAKSAAKAVGETVQMTKEKVKLSFSDKGHQPHNPEL